LALFKFVEMHGKPKMKKIILIAIALMLVGSEASAKSNLDGKGLHCAVKRGINLNPDVYYVFEQGKISYWDVFDQPYISKQPEERYTEGIRYIKWGPNLLDRQTLQLVTTLVSPDTQHSKGSVIKVVYQCIIMSPSEIEKTLNSKIRKLQGENNTNKI
jgi:hypothetical protein